MNDTTTETATFTPPARAYPQPSDASVLWRIARRGALESLRDRTTLLMGLIFTLALPLGMVLGIIRPLAEEHTAGAQEAVGTVIALYLLLAGLLPSNAAVGIAAGGFAGEKEKGNLTPLLASPASNLAIFGGKILAAVLPALLFSTIGEALYLLEIALFVGANWLALLPPVLTLSMVALVPAFSVLGATVASLISSRVRTFNAAQNISSLLVTPVTVVLFTITLQISAWGSVALIVSVAAIIALDLALIWLGATTWRREEVLARQ